MATSFLARDIMRMQCLALMNSSATVGKRCDLGDACVTDGKM